MFDIPLMLLHGILLPIYWYENRNLAGGSVSTDRQTGNSDGSQTGGLEQENGHGHETAGGTEDESADEQDDGYASDSEMLAALLKLQNSSGSKKKPKSARHHRMSGKQTSAVSPDESGEERPSSGDEGVVAELNGFPCEPKDPHLRQTGKSQCLVHLCL